MTPAKSDRHRSWRNVIFARIASLITTNQTPPAWNAQVEVFPREERDGGRATARVELGRLNGEQKHPTVDVPFSAAKLTCERSLE